MCEAKPEVNHACVQASAEAPTTSPASVDATCTMSDASSQFERAPFRDAEGDALTLSDAASQSVRVHGICIDVRTSAGAPSTSSASIDATCTMFDASSQFERAHFCVSGVAALTLNDASSQSVRAHVSEDGVMTVGVPRRTLLAQTRLPCRVCCEADP
eukprot:UN2935